MGVGGTTLQTLKLASLPSFSSSRFVFKPLPKTLTFSAPSRHGRTQRPPFPLIARALSAAPAVQTAPDETGDSHFALFFEFQLSFFLFFFFNLNFWFLILVMIDEAVKPQWKAAIDFKWIRENKEAVALNIEKRNSNANLETVLQLYDKMTHLQKVVILYSLIYANNHNQTLCIAFLFEFWKIQFHIDNSLVVSMCVNLCMCVYVSLFIY